MKRHLPPALLTTLLFLLATFAMAQDQRYYLYGGGQVPAGQPSELYTWLNGLPATDLVVYRVNNPGDVMRLGGPRHFDLTSGLELTEVMAREVTQVEAGVRTDIDLGVLPTGMYIAQLGPAATGSATVVLVTELAMVSKWDGDNLLVYTSDLVSGEPVDAAVFAGVGQNSMRVETTTGGVSLLQVGTGELTDAQLQLAANLGDSWAFSQVWWNQWTADVPDPYLVTDRPVYRPGHTVLIKGTVRLSRSVAPVAGEQVTVTVDDVHFSEILSTTLTTDEYGSFELELELADNAPLGYYSLRAEVAGSSGWSSFQVEEYTKPEYEVEVTANVPYAIQGDQASFTVAAGYLFGGPVAGGNVNYVVMSEPYSRWAWRSEYGFYDAYSSTYGGEVIARGQATLGPDGQVVIPVELQPQDADYRLTLQASVSDESQSEISRSASLVAYRANLVLGVSSERYAHPLGDSVVLTITAQDLEGNPLATDFSLDTERRYWVEDVGVVSEPGESLTGGTDASGQATVTISPNQAGSWRATVTGQDMQGRQTDNQADLWLYGGSAWYWDYQFLEVTADQDEYEPGDTARFVIQSPVADGWALITHEGGELADWELVRFQGNSLTHELIVDNSDFPNSHLGVAVVGDGEIYHTTVTYRVNPGSRFLDIDISAEADTFGPGDSAEFTISVTDHQGNPVVAQLTVGLVDEAIYLIRPERTPDIRGYFYDWRGNNVRTDLSTFAYFGQIAPAGAAREAMDEAVFAQAKEAALSDQELADAELRDDFRDTILWLTDVETDADGLATATVTFPDNLTRWRLTARAITQDGLVGQNTHAVTTTLPVIARLALPSFLVRGDEARIRVIGQSNLAEDTTAEFSLIANGLELPGEAQAARDLNLPAGARATADWLALAGSVGTVDVQAQVLTPIASDALSLPLPVVPHGLLSELVWSGTTADSWQFTLPDSMTRGSFRGSVTLTSDLSTAVASALDWLVGREYTYTELTMSSLLATNLAVEQGRPLPDTLVDVDGYMQDGIYEIYNLQHPDGGWGFWRFDVSDPMISAFVTMGLLQLQDAGFQVNDWNLELALDFLESAATKDTFQVYQDIEPAAAQATITADAKAAIWLALATAGRQVFDLSVMAGDPALSNHGLASSVLAFIRMDASVEAELHLDELISRATARDAVAYWEAGAPRYTWSHDRVETTALALQALAQLRPDHELIPRIVHWLLLERSGNYWYSSKDTLAVAQAARLLEPTGPAEADEGEVEPTIVTVRLNGIAIQEVEMADEPITIDLQGLPASGRNSLSFEASDETSVYASANVEFMIEEDFGTPRSQGIRVERTFELLTPVWVEEEQHFEYSRGPAVDVQVGDFVVASVTITPLDQARFVQVIEPLPAGFSVVEQDRSFRLAGIPSRYGPDYWGWNYWYDARQIGERSIDYWFSRVLEPVTFTYILRADHPGSYTALPSQVRLLYERDVYARTAAERLQIQAE